MIPGMKQKAFQDKSTRPDLDFSIVIVGCVDSDLSVIRARSRYSFIEWFHVVWLSHYFVFDTVVFLAITLFSPPSHLSRSFSSSAANRYVESSPMTCMQYWRRLDSASVSTASTIVLRGSNNNARYSSSPRYNAKLFRRSTTQYFFHCLTPRVRK